MSQAQITIQEAKTLIKEGKAKKLPENKILGIIQIPESKYPMHLMQWLAL